MLEAAVGQVRSFNRLVTQRVGALNDHYLARDRPRRGSPALGDRRRGLRRARGCGPGSASIRAISVACSARSRPPGSSASSPSADDRRVRTARLTPAGRLERTLLDRRSDELARSFLEPLEPGPRDRLVAAMAEVEWLLTAGLVEFGVVDPAERDAGIAPTGTSPSSGAIRRPASTLR